MFRPPVKKLEWNRPSIHEGYVDVERKIVTREGDA